MTPEDENALLRAENAALRAQVSGLPLAYGALGVNVRLACWLAIRGRGCRLGKPNGFMRCAAPIQSPECCGMSAPDTHGTADTSVPTARRCCRAPHRSLVSRWQGTSRRRSRQ